MKTKARRVLALFLCVLMFVGTMVTTVSATSTSRKGGGTTSIDNVTDILNALSYTEYISKYADKAKGEGVIEIRTLQAEGGKRMAAPDYFRGHPLEM